MAPRPARLASGLLVLTLLALGACDRSGSDDRAGPRTTAASRLQDHRHGAGLDRDHRAGVVHGGEDGPGGRQPRTGRRPSWPPSAPPVTDFDRVVFQFEGARVPGYRIEYVDEITLGESDDQFLTLQGRR